MKRFLFVTIIMSALLSLSIFTQAKASEVSPKVVDAFVILSNEGKGLISSMVDAGYGDMDLYSALVQMYNDSDPTIAPALPGSFLEALGNCPEGSEIFTTLVKDVNTPGISIAICGDGSVRVVNIKGSDLEETDSMETMVWGLGPVDAAYSNLQVPITELTVNEGESQVTYRVFAMAWKKIRQSFILSDEGAGLITKLVNKGYGDTNLYDVLAAIKNNSAPSTAGVITADFLDALSKCPETSSIFTETLKEYKGKIIAISDDGSVQEVSFKGSAYKGLSGTSTLESAVSGAGTADFTYSTTEAPLVTWDAAVDYSDGETSYEAVNTYEAFAIAWMPGSASGEDTDDGNVTPEEHGSSGGDNKCFIGVSDTPGGRFGLLIFLGILLASFGLGFRRPTEK